MLIIDLVMLLLIWLCYCADIFICLNQFAYFISDEFEFAESLIKDICTKFEEIISINDHSGAGIYNSNYKDKLLLVSDKYVVELISESMNNINFENRFINSLSDTLEFNIQNTFYHTNFSSFDEIPFSDIGKKVIKQELKVESAVYREYLTELSLEFRKTGGHLPSEKVKLFRKKGFDSKLSDEYKLYKELIVYLDHSLVEIDTLDKVKDSTYHSLDAGIVSILKDVGGTVKFCSTNNGFIHDGYKHDLTKVQELSIAQEFDFNKKNVFKLEYVSSDLNINVFYLT